MGYQVYEVGKRWGGYGVPAVCEHPDCNEEIDRGMAFACAGEPFSEVGCDLYFCSEHRHMVGWDQESGEEKWCEHEEDCDCVWKEVCERCRDFKPQFDYKPETQEWVEHLLKDKSWAEWRKNNPDEVAELMKQDKRCLCGGGLGKKVNTWHRGDCKFNKK